MKSYKQLLSEVVTSAISGGKGGPSLGPATDGDFGSIRGLGINTGDSITANLPGDKSNRPTGKGKDKVRDDVIASIEAGKKNGFIEEDENGKLSYRGTDGKLHNSPYAALEASTSFTKNVFLATGLDAEISQKGAETISRMLKSGVIAYNHKKGKVYFYGEEIGSFDAKSEESMKNTSAALPVFVSKNIMRKMVQQIQRETKKKIVRKKKNTVKSYSEVIKRINSLIKIVDSFSSTDRNQLLTHFISGMEWEMSSALAGAGGAGPQLPMPAYPPSSQDADDTLDFPRPDRDDKDKKKKKKKPPRPDPPDQPRDWKPWFEDFEEWYRRFRHRNRRIPGLWNPEVDGPAPWEPPLVIPPPPGGLKLLFPGGGGGGGGGGFGGAPWGSRPFLRRPFWSSLDPTPDSTPLGMNSTDVVKNFYKEVENTISSIKIAQQSSQQESNPPQQQQQQSGPTKLDPPTPSLRGIDDWYEENPDGPRPGARPEFTDEPGPEFPPTLILPDGRKIPWDHPQYEYWLDILEGLGGVLGFPPLKPRPPHNPDDPNWEKDNNDRLRRFKDLFDRLPEELRRKIIACAANPFCNMRNLINKNPALRGLLWLLREYGPDLRDHPTYGDYWEDILDLFPILDELAPGVQQSQQQGSSMLDALQKLIGSDVESDSPAQTAG